MKRALIAFGLFALLMPVTAQADPILVIDTNGLLTGATGVLVEGRLYDVEFVEGTCAEVFGGCDAGYFTFTTQSGAVAASQALLDLVFLDGSGLADAFDSKPDLTYGCTFEFNCYSLTPYGTSGRGLSSDGTVADGFLLLAQAVNSSSVDPNGLPGSPDLAGVGCSPCFPLNPSLQDTFYNSLTNDMNGTFARWTAVSQPPAPVPEPSSLFLLGIGFIGLVGRARHRHAPLSVGVSAVSPHRL